MRTRSLRRPAGLLSVLALALVFAAAPALAVPGSPGTAAAAATTAGPAGPTSPAEQPAGQSGNRAEVLVESLAPVVVRPGGDLVVAGQIANRSAAPLEDVQVRLRISRNALDRRGQVGEIADGDATTRIGVRLEQTLIDVTGELPPGGRARFTLRVPVEDLRLRSFGVYVLGVEALAVEERVGLARTFLPWVPADVAYSPARLAWAWPLVDRPHRGPDGVFRDDGLADSVRPGGRLHRLLTGAAASQLPVAWFLDPLLLEEVAAMADPAGYAVRDGRETVRGGGGAAAVAWLGALRSATSRAEVYLLPYADPDAVALTRAGQGRELARAAADGARVAGAVLGRRVRTDVAWPPEGALDYPTGRLLHDAGARAAVLHENVLPPRQPPSYTPDGRGALPLDGTRRLDALLYDERLSTLAGGTTAGPGVLTLQRFLAETAMVVAERPSDERTVLLAPPHRWDPPAERVAALLQQSREAPWLRPTGLAGLRSVPVPAIDRDPLTYPAQAQDRELPPSYLDQVDQLQRDAAVLGQVVEGDAGPAGGLLDAAQRLRSSAYRQGGADLRVPALAGARADVAQQQRSVRVAPGSVTLGDHEGTIPVTVINDLDQQVQVRLGLSSTSPKIRFDDGVAVTVPPRRNRTVLVPATAEANGLVPVAAQLLTAGGTTYGVPVELRVRVFTVPAVGIYLTAGAGVLLFARAALVLRHRLRPPRQQRPGEGLHETVKAR